MPLWCGQTSKPPGITPEFDRVNRRLLVEGSNIALCLGWAERSNTPIYQGNVALSTTGWR